jgi:hypothetical protein
VPGLVAAIHGTRIFGCAWHPRFRTYHVLVHLVAGPAIVASVVADEKLDLENLPAAGVGHGFAVDLEPSDSGADAGDRRLLIGETDEWFDLPAMADRGTGDVTLEEIIGAPRRRPWVSGKIYFDALIAGLSTETVVDLFYRDFLGRPAEPDSLAHYSGRVREGSLTYEALRAVLVGSQEYKLRWRRADTAPGAIFSQRIVLRAGNELRDIAEVGGGRRRTFVSLRRLLPLSGIDFIASAYRQLLGAPPAGSTLWCHVAELRSGRQRLDIVRELVGRPAAFARNVRLSDPIEEPAEPVQALPATAIAVPLADLLRLDGARFVSESYRHILGRQPGPDEAAYCLIASSSGKQLDILRYLASEPEAIARRVRLVEPPGPAAVGRTGASRNRRDRDRSSGIAARNAG